MKKKTFGTYLRRTLIALICVIILSLVGIFIFDRYPSANDDLPFDEESNEYWNVLEGFSRYEDLKANENKNNINSPEYILPYKVSDTFAKKISCTRYIEELEFLVKELQNRYNEVSKEIEKIEKLEPSSKAKWILDVLGVSISTELKTIYELVSSANYLGTEDEFYSLLENYESRSLYYAVIASGYDEYFVTLVNYVANGSDSKTLYDNAVENGFVGTFEEWVVEVCGFNAYGVSDDYSAYDHLVLNGYSGTIQDWYANIVKSGEVFDSVSELNYENMIANAISDYDLYMSIFNDKGKKDSNNNWIVRPAYDILNAKDEVELAELKEELIQLEILFNYAEEHKNDNNLKKWTEYFNRFQLIEELSNDQFDFYFSFGLTTFKLVDKKSNYEWYSNPENVQAAIKNQQNTVINIIYGTSTGAEIPYSNYDYSVSTVDVNGRTVDPNYAVKIINEDGKKAIQVWYRIEKRGIDFTYFPQYVSKTRIDELMERNANLASTGMVDSKGKKIPNILTSTTKYSTARAEKDKLKINNFYEPGVTPDTATEEQTKIATEKMNAKKAELEAIMKEHDPGYQCYSKWFESWYQLIPSDNTQNTKGYDYYEYKGAFTVMSEIQIKSLHTWMYEWCGYTTADLIEDNSKFEIEYDSNSFAFEVAIEYKMTDEGLRITIPGNSLREYGDYQLSKLDILPYFTATPNTIKGDVVDGYTIIPDGSGAILEHNNGKANLYDPYIKRIYTTDLSQNSVTKKGTSYDYLLPMYSVVNTVNGVTSAVIVEAESMASQLELRATTSGFGTLGENHNRNNFTAYLREGQLVKIGVYSKDPVQKFTNELIREDIILDYTFYSNAPTSDYQDEEIDYSFIASRYREKVIEKYGLENKVEKTKLPVLELDVIGAYTYTDNFLGISYKAKDTMTTYKELKEMIDLYRDDYGIRYINVFYEGWRKEALVDVSFKKMKTNSLLGTTKELEKLAKEMNLTIYPNVTFGEINDYQESFGSNHYTTRDVIGEIITKQPYALNTNTYDPKGRKISVLSPHYYYAFAQSLVDSYTKLFGENVAKENGVGINSISIDKFGSALAGDYKKNNEMYKTGAIRQQIKSLDLISSSIKNLNLYSPYEYTFKYINHAKDVPFGSTKKEILDYSIPFYQLVVNGIFDYSGESINANIESGEVYHIMKLIETGSNPQFTFTYDSSEELIKTEYNYYYNTRYTDWLNEVESIYNELVNLNIYSGRLVGHELIEPNVYVVTYRLKNNSEIKIGLNYSFAPVTVGTTTIPAKNYAIIK